MTGLPCRPDFLVILGDETGHEMLEALAEVSTYLVNAYTPGLVATPLAQRWTVGGLLWSCRPGREVARLAAQARQGCGAGRTWAQVQEMAAFAVDELQRHAQARADELNAAMNEDGALVVTFGDEEPELSSSGAQVELHGAAAILGAALLWSRQGDCNPPPAGDLTGNQVLSAFALLLLDHAVHAVEAGDASGAADYLAAGAQALNFSMMDAAQLDAARSAFKARAAEAAETVRQKRAAAIARHSKPGGAHEKHAAIRAAWASGKYDSRDICAEQEAAALGMSWSAARKALRNTPDPA